MATQTNGKESGFDNRKGAKWSTSGGWMIFYIAGTCRIYIFAYAGL